MGYWTRHLTTERVLFAAFLVLLVWLPIPLGSNRPWSSALMEIATFGLLGAWLVAWTRDVTKVPEPVRRAWPAWIVISLWLLLQGLHTVPLPVGLVEFLSPCGGAHPRAGA
jgi:hypothetical protein